jgi:quinol monooxygenase YgiN
VPGGGPFSADLEDDDRILGLEIWADRAAPNAHMAHDHTLVFLDVVPGLVAGEPAMSRLRRPPHLTATTTAHLR